MKSEFLARSPLLMLPLVALFFFLVVYLAVVVLTMSRKAKAFDPVASLPLDDDHHGDPS